QAAATSRLINCSCAFFPTQKHPCFCGRGGLSHAIEWRAEDMATIIGTNGNNTLNGGAENDLIFARGGADTVTGGDGDDVVIFETLPAGNDSFDGGTGDDVILLDVGLDQFIVSLSTASNVNDELILL